MATANDEGHVEIARAEPGPGAAAGVVPWAIVKAVAPGIFGPTPVHVGKDFCDGMTT